MADFSRIVELAACWLLGMGLCACGTEAPASPETGTGASAFGPTPTLPLTGDGPGDAPESPPAADPKGRDPNMPNEPVPSTGDGDVPAPDGGPVTPPPMGDGGIPAIDGGDPEPEPMPPLDLPGNPLSAFPPPEATDVCVDAPLRLSFDAPPRLGNAGRVRVYDLDSPSQPAGQLDMAQGTVSVSVDGTRLTVPRRAYVEGNEAAFYLPAGTFKRGHRYAVAIDAGVLSTAKGGSVAIEGLDTWTFTIAEGGTQTGKTWYVAADGSGDFCTIQTALSTVPAGNRTPLTIEIGPGTYHEHLRLRGKNELTLRGAGQELTLISGVNNEKLNGGTANRALIGIDSLEALTIEDLTVHNRTPQGGSQAEALRIQRCDRCVVRRVSAKSLQDTLLWSGRIYAEDCYVEGNVDYVWGTGAVFFNRCTFRTVGRKGYIVQARNPATTYGYVFVDSKLESDPGITGDILARIDVGVYPASHVALIDCELGPHIAPAGFVVTGSGLRNGLRFWEYGSHSPNGQPINTSGRVSGSRQLSASEAAGMRNPSIILGGWTPPAMP